MNWETVFADKHKGKTCIVIGNGPSLKNVPIDFLKKYPTFGTNRIYMRDDLTVDYYVAVNPLVVEQSAYEINQYNASAKFIGEQEANLILGCYPLASCYFPTFSYNPAAYVFEGHTVTYVCLQLAFHMGFKNVLLVGVDHRYQMDGEANSETTWTGDDPNHFTPEYFKGTRWNNPDLPSSEIAYRLARTAFEKVGRRVINVTENSALDVFERSTIKNWMR